MAESRKGPVKPPVLEMEANKPGPSQAGPGWASRIEPWQIGAGALAGLVFGLAGGFLAMLLFGGGQPGPDTGPGLAAVEARLDAAEAGLASIPPQLAETSAQLAALDLSGFARAPDIAGELRALSDRIAVLEQVADGFDPEEATAVNRELAALRAEIAAVARAPEPRPDAGALDALAERADALGAAQDELVSEVAALKGSVAALDAQQAALEERIAEQAGLLAADDKAPVAEDDGMRVQFAMAGFAEAMRAGGPYADALGVLSARFPDVAVSQTLSDPDGVFEPEAALLDRFETVLPQMIAALPLEGDGFWQEVSARVRGLLALRRVEDIDGEGPDAELARLEAALRGGNSARAEAAFDALPAEMREAGAALAEPLRRHAAGQRYLAGIRQAGLSARGASAETGDVPVTGAGE